MLHKNKPLSGTSFRSMRFVSNYCAKVFVQWRATFLREQRNGFVNTSSGDAKINWYFLFSTSPILALASNVAVNPIEEASIN